MLPGGISLSILPILPTACGMFWSFLIKSRKQALCRYRLRRRARQGQARVIGDITATIADFVIFTNDNPRFEPPEEIIAHSGRGKSDNYIVIIDRETAIVEASRRALKAILSPYWERKRTISNYQGQKDPV